MKLVLASRSKRRSAILKSCRIRHSVIPSRIKEVHDETGRPHRLVMLNARLKAMDVARRSRRGIIVGVDTLVLFKGRVVGKPRSKKEARQMLKSFGGNRLSVYTGISVFDTGASQAATGYEKTTLYVKKIPRQDMGKYFSHLGPYDKAGGFSIEGIGSLVFDDLKGSYFNVLGLPMRRLQQLFGEIGLDLLDFAG